MMYARQRLKRNFILNRGRNAGKPLQEPCLNCFILYCSSLEEMELSTGLFYALWKHGFFTLIYVEVLLKSSPFRP